MRVTKQGCSDSIIQDRPGMISAAVMRSQVGRYSAISISTLNHGHGHLEIVTCDSKSLAGAFATVAM